MNAFASFLFIVFVILFLSPAINAQNNNNNNNNVNRLIDDLERNRDDLSRNINDIRRIRGRGEMSRADLAEVSRRSRDALNNIDNVRDDLINLDNASRAGRK